MYLKPLLFYQQFIRSEMDWYQTYTETNIMHCPSFFRTYTHVRFDTPYCLICRSLLSLHVVRI
jgi:hypothetical protein